MKNKRFKVTLIAIGLTYTGICVLLSIFSDSIERKRAYYWIYMGIYTILTLVYLLVFIRMLKSFRRLKDAEMDSEKRSVVIQFVLFLFAFITRLITTGICEKSNEFNYTESLITIILYIPWNFFTIFYILIVHYKTYKKMAILH